jgi:pseudouridine-5'-phosphate glycosidase
MSNEELEAFARRGPEVAKCSTRELPLVMATQRDGATTVAATARLAASVGVEVFVTGGCGGVHRGGESSWDVSADLVELSKVPVLVVRDETRGDSAKTAARDRRQKKERIRKRIQ